MTTSKIITQEFRVLCSRPSGGLQRSRTSKNQDQDLQTVYASGRGASVGTRMKNAKRAAMKAMSSQGWNRFSVSLTIADEELALAEYRDRYLADLADTEGSSKLDTDLEKEKP